MRINKRVEAKFKYRYDWVMEDIRASLLILAAISIALNTMSSPVLGIKALIIFIFSVFFAWATEVVYFMFAKELEYDQAKEKVKGSFPEVIGLLFAFLIPIGTPLYAIVISLGLGIFVAKIAFGGFSNNIFNVAIVSVAICYVSWQDGVSPILSDNNWLDYLLIQASNLLQTPLFGVLAMPEVVTVNAPANAGMLYPTWSVFTNNPQVMLGLIPTIIVLPIGIRLMLNDAIDYFLPLVIGILTIAGSFLIAFFMHDMNFLQAIWFGLNSLFGTIMLFVAIFIASDPVTSPNSRNTQYIYALIIVVVTLYIREISSNIEGVVYAILFANMFVPLLNAKSDTMSRVKVRNLLGAATFLFALTMIFIGYNSNLENIQYQEYDHYSINRNVLSCEEVDGETSATIPEEETSQVESACTQTVENNNESVDAQASATKE